MPCTGVPTFLSAVGWGWYDCPADICVCYDSRFCLGRTRDGTSNCSLSFRWLICRPWHSIHFTPILVLFAILDISSMSVVTDIFLSLRNADDSTNADLKIEQ